MNDVVVFTGPTLSAQDAASVLDAVYLPPVSQGDVYRVCQHRPAAIGIVDGYFDAVPAVWHKEVLWALRQGVQVFGSASMGALRAAELHTCGMVGVGWVFEQFRSGALEDDDEVAVVHGPADTGYLRMSEAMVNVRATLAAAVATGVVRPATGDRLVALAKSLPYAERAYRRLVRLAAEQQLDSTELGRFDDWWPGHAVDVKRADALEMLAALQTWREAGRPAPQVSWSFEHTSLWEQLRRTAGSVQLTGGVVAGGPLTAELRLQPQRWRETVARARLRALLLEEAQRQKREVDDEGLFEAVVRFREDRQLWQPEELQDWLDDNDLTPTTFLRLVRQTALAAAVETTLPSGVLPQLVDQIRLDGAYPELADRVRDKQPLTELVDAEPPDPAVYDEAVAWYFRERLGRPARTLAQEAAALDFGDEQALLRALVVEHLHERQQSGARH